MSIEETVKSMHQLNASRAQDAKDAGQYYHNQDGYTRAEVRRLEFVRWCVLRGEIRDWTDESIETEAVAL
jgi:hypothetical protein